MDPKTAAQSVGIPSESSGTDASVPSKDISEFCDEDQPLADNRNLKRKSSEDDNNNDASQDRKRQCGTELFQDSAPSLAEPASHPEVVPCSGTGVEPTHEQLTHGEGNADANCDQIDRAPAKNQSVDQFFDELAGILQETGGLNQPQDVHILEGLMRREQRLRHRWTLLTVTEQSSHDCQRHLVKGEGLQTLERWLVEARDANKPQFLTKIIKCLSILPVDFESLKKCSIGKTIGLLRRHNGFSVKTAAKVLVGKWKSIVEKERNKGPAARELEKAENDGESKAGSQATSGENLVKPLPVRKWMAGQEGQAFKPPTRGGEQLFKQPSHKNRISPEAKTTGSLSSILRALVSGPTQLPGSNDLLPDSKCEAARQNLLSRSISGSKLESPAKHQTGRREEGESYPLGQDKLDSAEARKSNNSSPAVSGEFASSSNETCTTLEPDAELKIPGDSKPAESHTPSQSDSIQMPRPEDAVIESSDAQKEASEAKNSCLSKLGTLAGNIDSNRVGSINTPFLPQRPQPPASAKAVQNLPASPPRSPNRKTKGKRVSWAPEEKLSSVRWFKMDDPPENVCKDSFYTAEESLALNHLRSLESPHDPFLSAARLEHLNESQAIRASKQLDTKERAQVMVCKIEWKKPPRVSLNPDWKIAFGDGSKEKSQQSRREENVVAMRNAKNTIIPSNPIEPDAEPAHRGNAIIIPYNTPTRHEGHHPQPLYTKPFVVQSQGPMSQQHSGGPRPILVQNQGFPGYVGQGHYIPQQVSLHRSGQPQTFLLLPSSVGNQQVIMSSNSSLPMVMSNRPNQSIIVPANGNQPVAIQGGQHQVFIPGNPHPLQMQGQPVHFQLPLRNVLDGQARMQQMVLSGMNPGLCTHLHPNPHHQQVIVGGVPNHGPHPQRGLTHDLSSPDQNCQTSPSKMPGKGPG